MIILNKEISKKQKTLYDLMKFFRNTPRTESAFYLRFQLMDPADISMLMTLYAVDEEWDVFKIICKYWNVK